MVFLGHLLAGAPQQCVVVVYSCTGILFRGGGGVVIMANKFQIGRNTFFRKMCIKICEENKNFGFVWEFMTEGAIERVFPSCIFLSLRHKLTSSQRELSQVVASTSGRSVSKTTRRDEENSNSE